MQKLLFFFLLAFLSFNSKAQEVSINQSFEDITEVKINMVFCDIEIESTEGNAINVEGYIRYTNSKDEYAIDAYKKGTTLIIEVDHPKRSKGSASGKFHLTMPALTDVNATNVSGDIMIKGVGQKYVKLNTVSGEIRAEHINSDLNANSVSGDIDVNNIKGNLNLSTISGDQSISDVDGNFKGSSISGDFQINNLKGSRNISTISGSIR